MATPKINKTTCDDLAKRMADRGRSTIPEWNLPKGAPETWPTTDSGVALLKIFANMWDEVNMRLNRVPDKNFVAFLDMIGIRLMPAQPARAPMTFYPVEGFANPIFVRAGIAMAAAETAAHPALTYQTERSFSACDAPLIALYSIDPVNDEIYDNLPDLIAQRPFQPFSASTSETKVPKPILYLGHSKLFIVGGSIDIKLKFPSDVDPGKLEWKYTEEDGNVFSIKAENVAWDSPNLTLKKVGTIKETEVNGISSLWIMGQGALPSSLSKLKDIKIIDLIGTGSTVPDYACYNFTPLDLKSTTYPLSRKPRLFDSFYIANKEVFSKAGAEVKIDFTLADPKPINPPAGYPAVDAELTWEYNDGQAWRIFSPTPDTTENTKNLKDGGLFTFICPDIQISKVNEVENYWIRATITKGDYGSERLEPAPALPVPTLVTIVDVDPTGDGSLSPNTKYYGACAPINGPLSGGSSNVINITTRDDHVNTHRIDLTIPQVTGATFYDIFLSTDPQPRWVGRISEGQRAAGGCEITDVNIVQSGGGNAAGTVRIRVPGTGQIPPAGSTATYIAQDRFTPPILSNITIAMTASNIVTGGKPLEHSLAYSDLSYVDLAAIKDAEGTVRGVMGQRSLAPSPGSGTNRTIQLGFKNPFLDGNISLFFHVDESQAPDPRPALKWSYWGGDIKLEGMDVDAVSTNTKLQLRSEKGFGLETELMIQQLITPDAGDPFVVSENAIIKSMDSGWVVLDRLLGYPFTKEKAAVTRRIYLQCVDNTDDLGTSDTLEFIAPGDQNKATLFGKECYWLMCSLEGAGDVPPILGVYPNTAWAEQRETVPEEILGSSDGTKKITLTFQKKPVLSCEIWVREGIVFSKADKDDLPVEISIQEVTDNSGSVVDTWVRWVERDDFFESDCRSRHYILDPAMGEVTFGDGDLGMIPPIGSQNIKAKYTWGGGVAGNVSAGEINSLKDTVAGIEKVANCQPAGGGSDTELISAVPERGPHVIRHRYRAVTKEDYERLAKDSSSYIARTKCVSTGNRLNLIVIPKGTEDRPTPSQGLLDLVKKYLLQRSQCSIPQTSLHVVGPTYKDVRISVDIYTTSIDLAVPVKREILIRLNQYLHPLTGGPDGNGWDFGRSVYRSDLYAMLESISGVDHAENLFINESAVDLTSESMEIVCSGNHIVNIVLGA